MPTKEIANTQTAEISEIGLRLRELIDAVPQTTADDAQFRMIEQILQARSAAELDAPWGSTAGLGEYNGETVTVHSIKRAPSSFAGVGIFLILDVTTEDGEHHVVTTGSVSVMTQLLKAYELNAFPLKCRPVVSERASGNGYYPQHLEMVA